MKKLRWGVLSTAKIGREKVIPALQKSTHNQVLAICSRDEQSARRVADELHIERAYGTYEELLADTDIDAIYNPLPNHLHVDWSIKALQAGKHVLCEKPLGLNTADAQRLVDAARAHPQLKVMEAFMYRFHPQWQLAKQLVDEGRIGKLHAVHSHFSYNNREPDNIRNKAEWGGGALLDIGCYSISLSRWLFNEEPTQVLGQITPMPGEEVDCLTSAIMEFSAGSASFTAATKIEPIQYAEAIGDEGSLYLERPFYNDGSEPVQRVRITRNRVQEVIEVPDTNHYSAMGDAFALSIFNDSPVPTPLDDAIANMRAIDATFESAAERKWIAL
ncbi:Gfo/Idh/MocA family protein [Cellvibrio fibrivorans]|uniref:Dehydrogenase n=1 Tax=Cellvibrio fibrivorans TaxID=126350 RepID=A0ABU1USA1_9GAMM|nr:Gfo/Idh/MocA family oxidoreductase [Cellvibrio fibrivorans]MDR7088061.1 putative dehydrogenase [Cellvibrio fibrivorans]